MTWTYIQSRVHTLPNILKYVSFAKGPIASIGALEGLGFIRTSFANRTFPDWPDFQIHFLSGCISSGLLFLNFLYRLSTFILSIR